MRWDVCGMHPTVVLNWGILNWGEYSETLNWSGFGYAFTVTTIYI